MQGCKEWLTCVYSEGPGSAIGFALITMFLKVQMRQQDASDA
jgi:hypothetical protein